MHKGEKEYLQEKKKLSDMVLKALNEGRPLSECTEIIQQSQLIDQLYNETYLKKYKKKTP